jgi:hypothetical protein
VTAKSQAPRRTALVVASATLFLLSSAGPSFADVPDGWSNPSPVSPVDFVLKFVGIPILITLAILAFVYLPGIVRGESVAPAGARSEDEWFGGRRDTRELESASTTREAESDDGDRGTGGASGTW